MAHEFTWAGCGGQSSCGATQGAAFAGDFSDPMTEKDTFVVPAMEPRVDQSCDEVCERLGRACVEGGLLGLVGKSDAEMLALTK